MATRFHPTEFITLQKNKTKAKTNYFCHFVLLARSDGLKYSVGVDHSVDASHTKWV